MCQILTPWCWNHLPTRINMTQTVGSFNMWETPKSNRLSFFVILLMHWMVCSVCYLGCVAVNINALFGEWRINERDYFQLLLLGILSGMEPTIFFSYIARCCDGHFSCFAKYIFPQLQTCSAHCTEGSCSSNIPRNF